MPRPTAPADAEAMRALLEEADAGRSLPRQDRRALAAQLRSVVDALVATTPRDRGLACRLRAAADVLDAP